jgi:hypothetical protein
MNPDKMPTDGQELEVYRSLRNQPVLNVLNKRRQDLLGELVNLEGTAMARMQGRVKEVTWQMDAIEKAPDLIRKAQGGRR